jgi:hypothetical protein
MLKISKLTGARRSASAIVAIAAVFVVAAAAYGAVREVGATSNFSAIPCKDNNCRILTRVTAFQMKVGSTSNVSRVPRDGNLIAYTISLPTVTKKFVTNFNSNYSGEPTARISVIRYAPRKGVTKYRYKLVGQSEPIKLARYLGSTPSFALPTPIPVKKSDIIAITTDSWMPAFSATTAANASDVWRASRPSGKCGPVGDDYTNFKTARMHEKIGQIRQYNCGYKQARVLYHATVVDLPKKTKGYK